MDKKKNTTDTMEDNLTQKTLAKTKKYWLMCLLVVGFCTLIGVTKAFARYGFSAIMAVFVASTVFAFFMPDVMD